MQSTPSTPGSNVLSSIDEKPGMQEPDETFLSNAEVSGPDEIRFTCGDGYGDVYQVDQSDMSIPVSAEVVFDYEIHNGIDITVSDALRDIKLSIMQGIADVIQCDIAYSGRRLQNGFDDIIGLWSNSFDLPDPVASGCIVDVNTTNPSTCTPVSGGFTFFATSGTSKAALDDTSKSLLAIVQTSMDSGQYETGIVEKAIYIGEREKVSKSPILAEAMIIHTEGTNKSNKGLMITIYVLASACILLICIVCITARMRREKTVDVRHGRGSQMTFRSFMTHPDGSQNDPESQRSTVPHPWQRSQPMWQREHTPRHFGPNHRSMPIHNPKKGNTFQSRREVASSLPATTTRRYADRQDDLHGAAALSSLWSHRLPEQDDEVQWNQTSPVQDDGMEAYPTFVVAPLIHQNRTDQQSEGDSSSSDSSESSASSSEETEQINDPVTPTRQSDDALNVNLQSLHSFDDNHGAPAFSNSAKSLQSESSTSREERQERLARARARSAGRQQSRRLS